MTRAPSSIGAAKVLADGRRYAGGPGIDAPRRGSRRARDSILGRARSLCLTIRMRAERTCPDITMVMPCVLLCGRGGAVCLLRGDRGASCGYRGAQAGSMDFARRFFRRVADPPVKTSLPAQPAGDVLKTPLANVRTPREREGDLTAQIASCRIGERRLAEIVSGTAARKWRATAASARVFGRDDALGAARHSGRDLSRGIISTTTASPRNRFACGHDSGSRRARGSGLFGLDLNAPQRECGGGDCGIGGVLRFSVPARRGIPATSGLMRPIRVIAPEGTIVNASAASCGGRNAGDGAADGGYTAARLARAMPKESRRQVPAR